MERTGVEQWKPREVARLLALVETERRYYQEMMAALPAALVVLASDRTILSANMAFRRLVGLSGEELRKRSIEQILPSNELIERIRSTHVQGDTGPFTINMGERRFRMAAAPIRSWEDEAEPETLLLVEQADIVEQAGPAPAAPKPAAAFDVAALPVAVWQADASTFAFTYAGGAAEQVLGYPPAHWLEEPLFFSQRFHPDDRDEVLSLYRSIAATGGEASAEFRALSATSAEVVWCRETIRVPAPGEGARSITGVMSVIEECRQLEAQAVAAARVDALRGLCSRLAHDLNNPLMIVSGYGEELLNALAEGDPMRGDLTQLLSASGRLAELAGRLLGFTRAQAQAPSKVELGKLAADIATPGFDVDLEISSPEGGVRAFADAAQLKEAMVALAACAIENTSEVTRLRVVCDTIRIVNRVEAATLKPGIHARIVIHAEGRGTGVPAGIFESILPPKDPTQPALDIARAYLNVRQWGGDIEFSSSPAEGSAFTVYLPYAEPEETAAVAALPEIEAPEPPVAPPPEAPAPEPSLGTVLVVEDEPGIRGLVRKILKRERFEVLEAGNGEEALAAASAHGGAIGLLLTDVMLPGIGGRELAETLVAAQPDLRVVYISGFTDDESVRAGQFPPGSKFLQKPFTLSALVSAVKAAFEL